MKTIRRRVIGILLAVILALVMTEALLRMADPWGVVRLYDDLNDLIGHQQLSPSRGYILQAGTYNLHRWSVTELANGERAIPANPGGACTLVIVGDSVAWGQSASDADTWVNLVAGRLSGINVINAAYWGYNSTQALGTLRDYPKADAILYLAIDNDPEGMYIPAPMPPASAVYLYLAFLRKQRTAPDDIDMPRFYRDMDAITADQRVTVVAFDAPFGQTLAARYPVRLIPPYTHPVSFADGHPDGEGHKQIAAAMLPIVQQIIREKCKEKIS